MEMAKSAIEITRNIFINYPLYRQESWELRCNRTDSARQVDYSFGYGVGQGRELPH